jgi:hypothetical protein
VISTFFLAFLRYLGNLYRVRYLQVTDAERDDFAVRKFYVAMRNSSLYDENRKAVLAAFMAAATNDIKGADHTEDSTKQEFEIIKELMKALSKKL